MRRLAVTLAAITLIIPALAMAQPAHEKHAPAGGAHPAHRAPGHTMQRGAGTHRGPTHAGPTHRGPVHRPPMHAGPRPHPGMNHRPGMARHNQFRYHGRYFNRVHGAPFRYPHGWHYRRWTVGVVFPALFLTPAYFYTDWAMLGLAAPAPGYAWVRFGPDLVLVNLTTHEVDNVVYGVFF